MNSWLQRSFLSNNPRAEVKVAASAAEALLVLDDFKPDVLVSDIGMPDVDGYMFIHQIRSRPQGGKIPAIALTAYAGEMDLQQAQSSRISKASCQACRSRRLC